MNIPELQTERLRLRGFRRSDIDAYAQICADPEVMRHIGNGGPVGPDIAWRQMAGMLGEWALHGRGMWAIERRSDRRLIGRVGLIEPLGWPGCELGWLLEAAAWGQGYAFEAARAARAFSRDALGAGTLISLIRADNTASNRLAERLGARCIGEVDFLGSTIPCWQHPDD
ncbi:GNAT family N-acetyltransferase [Piscinibacter sakaiensis]|uniref:GNAT family N-acetyltransferase n=1 Tax=Piscinibacter sakaiensis TaxID=1547922 RepID=UPI003AAF7D94